MIASFYAGILSLMYLALSIHVIKTRRRFRVAIGDDNNFELKRRISAQMSFADYGLFFIILLGYSEYNGLSTYLIHCLAIIFIAGRMMHTYSLLVAEKYIDGKITNRPIWRIRGMLCTLGCIGILSIILIYQYLIRLQV